MKRSFWLALVALVAFSQPAWAQQDDVTRLRAELQRQQEIIGQLLKRLDDLEKKQALTATNEELKQEAQTQQDAVESVRETLLSRVWGYDYAGETRTVDVHVHWLRAELEADPANPELLQTVRGVGYVFRRPS